MKARLYKVFLRITILMAAGAAYALFYLRTGIGIPCPLRALTGLKCPGCGVTRLCISLLKGDFAAAWHYHPVLFCILPLLAVLLLWSAYRYVKTGTVRYPPGAHVLLYLMIAALLVFCVVRNVWELS